MSHAIILYLCNSSFSFKTLQNPHPFWGSTANIPTINRPSGQGAEAAIRSIMSQPEHAQRLLDEHDPASVARSAAMGDLG